MSSATQLRLSKVFGPDLIAREDLSSIAALNEAPWNHDGHPKDLLSSDSFYLVCASKSLLITNIKLEKE